MSKALLCAIHPKYYIQWIRFSKDDVVFGCIQCLNQLNDRAGVLYLPEIIENPEILLPQLQIEQRYINLYNNLNTYSEKAFVEKYLQLEKSLTLLCELLKNIIDNGKQNLEQFKKRSKEAKQELYSVQINKCILQELKIQKIADLIKELYQTPDENLEVQREIQKKLQNIKQYINKDLMREQSSKIKKIFTQTQLAINKYQDLKYFRFNLYCKQQINSITRVIDSNFQDLKEYFQDTFHTCFHKCSQREGNQRNKELFGQSTKSVTKTLSLYEQISKSFPYFNSEILPQYYFDYIFNYEESERQRNVFHHQKYQQYCSYLMIQEYYKIDTKFKDEQNIQKFWKIDLTSLNRGQLIIFKSKNDGNPIFGYFKSLWADFIFSYTNNEIYPKKQVFGQAIQTGILDNIQFNEVSSNTFTVGKFDILINQNMIDGFSCLGTQYQWDNYNNNMQNHEHLFGGPKPNIQLCEIFYF